MFRHYNVIARTRHVLVTFVKVGGTSAQIRKLNRQNHVSFIPLGMSNYQRIPNSWRVLATSLGKLWFWFLSVNFYSYVWFWLSDVLLSYIPLHIKIYRHVILVANYHFRMCIYLCCVLHKAGFVPDFYFAGYYASYF